MFKTGIDHYFDKRSNPSTPAAGAKDEALPPKRKTEELACDSVLKKARVEAPPAPLPAPAPAAGAEPLFEEKDMIQIDVAGIKGLFFGYGRAGQLLFKAGDAMLTNKKIAPKTVLHLVHRPGKIVAGTKGFQWSGS